MKLAIAGTNFIPSIVGFDSKSISNKTRSVIESQYLSDPNFNFDKVNRSSQACGPLVQWLVAQMKYSEILDNIQPLKEEIAGLEAAKNKLSDEQEKVQKTVAELETTIARYKAEYAALISDAQQIKTELTKVKEKVDRSIALISRLSSESERWEEQRKTFQASMATVVGDMLLCSAFIAYSGFFDQNFRKALLTSWGGRLSQVR